MSFDPIMKNIILNEAKSYTDEQIQRIRENVLLDGVFEPDESNAIMVDDIGVKPGDTVKVIWNGVEYTCVAVAPPAETGVSVFFGNEGLINGEDNGVPFAYATMSDGNGNTMSGFIGCEGSVSIKVIGETTEDILNDEGKIANNFMPNWSVSNSVDLDFYGIGQVTLSLFAQGGGSTTVENAVSFWSRLSKKENLLLSLNYSGMTIIIDGHTRFVTFDDDLNMSCIQLCYSFMAIDETLAVHKIDVSIARYGDSAVVVVKVA